MSAHRISVVAPVVAHKGPHDTDASLLRKAARSLERGYELGGSNLTAAVVELLRSTAESLDHNPRSAKNVDGDLIALGGEVVHAGSGRIYEVRGLYVSAGGLVTAQCFSVGGMRTVPFSIDRLRPLKARQTRPEA